MIERCIGFVVYFRIPVKRNTVCTVGMALRMFLWITRSKDQGQKKRQDLRFHVLEIILMAGQSYIPAPENSYIASEKSYIIHTLGTHDLAVSWCSVKLQTTK
jgi:hypothetical protein